LQGKKEREKKESENEREKKKKSFEHLTCTSPLLVLDCKTGFLLRSLLCLFADFSPMKEKANGMNSNAPKRTNTQGKK
jgi:hypothetical protein